MDLFEAADLTVRRSSAVNYKAEIDDPRIESVRILRPQEIPSYVADGLFDLGITGRDWVEETGSKVESLGELRYSKATTNPITVVVAVPGDSPYQQVTDLPAGVRVSSEYPELTKRYFADKGVDADIRLSYGATEAKVPDIVDCVVDITETGSGPPGRRTPDHRRHPGLVHRAGGQSGGLRGPGQAPRHGTGHDAAAGGAGGPGQGPGQAQRRGGGAGRRDRGPARHEDADGQRAVRLRRATRWRRSCPSTRSTS